MILHYAPKVLALFVGENDPIASPPPPRSTEVQYEASLGTNPGSSGGQLSQLPLVQERKFLAHCEFTTRGPRSRRVAVVYVLVLAFLWEERRRSGKQIAVKMGPIQSDDMIASNGAHPYRDDP